MSDVTCDMAKNEMEVHHRKVKPWRVTLASTGEETMTGGRLKRVASCLRDESAFCFTYGVSDINISIIELATHFGDIRPDVVPTVADRFETLSKAVAASYMNIPLTHTQGGEVTGSIDESVRHAITKVAHVHFPATKRAPNFLR